MFDSTQPRPAEEAPIPAEQSFTLADGTSVHVAQSDDGSVAVTLSSTHLASLERQERTIRTSLYGVVNDDREIQAPILLLKLPQPANISIDDLWAAIYALWIRYQGEEVLPLALDSVSITNVDEVRRYLVHTGLAFDSPTSQGDLLLVRAALWQGAGAPLSRHWLRALVPHPSISSFPFPFFTSFTRGANVLTTHPRRPPKPAPGQSIYFRYIFSVGETLEFVHIDANNPEHFEAYTRWQNSDRVNVGWRERGPDEKHRAYLADRLADPHIMGFVVKWNGELAGYGEMAWVKEDPMGTYVGGLGDYDQGTHLLIGEERFRGRHRFTAVMTSMKHMCFLRDPRTEVVVGEPRADLPIVPRLKAFLPQEFNREFEFPHKRSVYFVLRRERFFQAAILY
ncbi:GNAT family acetyltransferase [Ceratobasidium sp. AG-Ba]|nr:GNAT family acetyltransferase [Ceratobasidium sp. AG-Ba]